MCYSVSKSFSYYDHSLKISQSAPMKNYSGAKAADKPMLSSDYTIHANGSGTNGDHCKVRSPIRIKNNDLHSNNSGKNRDNYQVRTPVRLKNNDFHANTSAKIGDHCQVRSRKKNNNNEADDCQNTFDYPLSISSINCRRLKNY